MSFQLKCILLIAALRANGSLSKTREECILGQINLTCKRISVEDKRSVLTSRELSSKPENRVGEGLYIYFAAPSLVSFAKDMSTLIQSESNHRSGDLMLLRP
jgi:hypothetical protein